jgi:hypothetical protein
MSNENHSCHLNLLTDTLARIESALPSVTYMRGLALDANRVGAMIAPPESRYCGASD